MRFFAIWIVVGGLFAWSPARADDECPMDLTVAAGGTWSTLIAEEIDACFADPVCRAAAMAPPDPDARPEHNPRTSYPGIMPPARDTRGPRGAFARGMVRLGSGGRAYLGGDHDVAEGHLLLDAGGQAGWHRGPRICAKTTAELGTATNSRTAFGIVTPQGFWSVALGIEQDLQVRPRLSDARIWLSRPYTVTRVRGGGALATWRRADGGTSAVTPLRVTAAQREHIGDVEVPSAERTLHKTLGGSLFEDVRARWRTEVIPWKVEAVYAGRLLGQEARPPGRPPVGQPAKIWLGHLGLVSLAHTFEEGARIELDARVVFGTRLACVSCQPYEGTIAFELPSGDADTWGLRVERQALLTIDEVVAIEDRVTFAHERRQEGRYAARISGFAAATRTTQMATADPDLTGGAQLSLEVSLKAGITLTAEIELARSFYANVDGPSAPVPKPAALIGLGLHWTMSR